ncbi:DUF1570 domain-containing protein [Qipengyuania sp. XHP0207]|uniref:DUF1570 domain-containing protein n=1 Tax=Qipengyuania sp. XHP0207 TaxID=3038078 RepID=UPI00241C960A|nr:DUF1570 domain-containing protein [Qipengyuania sp. XHP0207]MDG5748884.1 DUF1570 domain-containing protein [Qipengyuania sp. XHP0207]
MRYLTGLLAAALFVTPAQADWHVAQSDNFVVYADDRWQDVQEFAEALERYHSAMSLLQNRERTAPSPSNRVTIYVVGNESKIRKLVGEDARNIAGFYIPRAGSSVAFVPVISMRGRETDFSVTVLLHEYAHHFLISNSPFAMPRWVNEGGAEFYASAKFEKDGGIAIGRPAYHRAAELAYAKDVSVEELIDPDLYEKNKGKRFDAFYGRAWALYHYLFFSDERRGQFSAYLNAIVNGSEPRQAAIDAFGDLAVLQKDLDRYIDQRRMSVFELPVDLVPIGAVEVRKLSEGEAAAMPLRIRSRRGVTQEQAAELLPDMREIAQQYPNDAAVLAALAVAEFDAGNDDAAIIAADRALAIDPATKDALVQKGFALFRKAEEAEDRDAAYADAMVPFSALNRLETDHPLPLMYYYRSFVERGKEPNETARHALERASQLAPFDKSLRFNTALMQAAEGKIAAARYTMAPLASDPHGGGMAGLAQRYRLELAEAEEGEPWFPQIDIAVDDAVEAATAE